MQKVLRYQLGSLPVSGVEEDLSDCEEQAGIQATSATAVARKIEDAGAAPARAPGAMPLPVRPAPAPPAAPAAAAKVDESTATANPKKIEDAGAAPARAPGAVPLPVRPAAAAAAKVDESTATANPPETPRVELRSHHIGSPGSLGSSPREVPVEPPAISLASEEQTAASLAASETKAAMKGAMSSKSRAEQERSPGYRALAAARHKASEGGTEHYSSAPVSVDKGPWRDSSSSGLAESVKTTLQASSSSVPVPYGRTLNQQLGVSSPVMVNAARGGSASPGPVTTVVQAVLSGAAPVGESGDPANLDSDAEALLRSSHDDQRALASTVQAEAS